MRGLMLGVLLFAGCGAATRPVVDEDAGTEPEIDSGPTRRDSGAPPGEELIFRLSFLSKFGSMEQLFVQESSSLGEGPAWLSVRSAESGAPVEIVGRCDLCECPTAGDRCLTCPRCGPPPDVVRRLDGAGDRIDFRWDQQVHITGVCDAGELAICSERPFLVRPGEYIATFCWSVMATGEGMGHTVGMTVCNDVPFRLPDADGIVEDEVCFCG